MADVPFSIRVAGDDDLTVGTAYAMVMLMERDAANFHALAATSAVVLLLADAAALSAPRFLPVDLGLDGAVVNTLDPRLRLAKLTHEWIPYLGFVPLALAVFVLARVFVRREDLRLGATLLDAASAVLSLTGLNVVVPVATTFALGLIAAWFAAGFFGLSSIAVKHWKEEDALGYGLHGTYRAATVAHALICVFLTLTLNFVVRCVVSAHVNHWYWAREPREAKLDEMTIARALRRVCKYHFGSLALLAFWLPWMYPARVVVRATCVALGRVGTKSPHKSDVLSYTAGSVSQIALHGCSLRRGVRTNTTSRCDTGTWKRCSRATWGVLFAGGIFSAFAVTLAGALCHVDAITPDGIQLPRPRSARAWALRCTDLLHHVPRGVGDHRAVFLRRHGAKRRDAPAAVLHAGCAQDAHLRRGAGEQTAERLGRRRRVRTRDARAKKSQAGGEKREEKNGVEVQWSGRRRRGGGVARSA